MDDIVEPYYMRDLVLQKKWTHKKISQELRKKYPDLRGLSEMSVRRFCSKHDIHRTSRITDGELDVAVFNAVSKVGPTYGRKMIKGKLEAENIKVHDKRISASLTRVTPDYQQLRRQNTARLVNPVPYHADYFGHKLHFDQNEKLVMYGCTSVIAIDGYSNSILGIATMAIKNNLEIYRCLYRPIIIHHGLWDQVRVDCGKEFYLMLHIQESLANLRYNTLRAPYIQTPSTKNHIAERKWVEVNSRINYPIKALLNKMVEEELFDLRNDTDKYCVSWVTMQVVQAGVNELIPAWNYHSIPGKGRPIDLMMINNRVVAVPESVIPTPENALQHYEMGGGKLKSFGVFGKDPLAEALHLQEARRKEFEKCPTFDKIFNGVVNNDSSLLRQSIQSMIAITKNLASQIV